MIVPKIKEDKKDICLKGISNFKESLKKYLIVEQKHIILIVEDFEKKMARELTIDLNMIQKIKVNSEVEIETTRCPIRIDKELYTSQKGSPKIGEHNTKYLCKERGNKNGKRNLL